MEGASLIIQVIIVIQVIVTIALIISEKVDKTIVVFGSALFTTFVLVFGMGEHAEIIYELLDFHTLFLIIGLMLAVEIVNETGFLDYLALYTVKLAKGDPFKIFIFFGVLDIFISAFLDNVSTIIILGSLTIVICRRLEISPIPFILFESFMTGVAALLTPVGSVPNIIINSKAGIPFITFMGFMVGIMLLSSVITYGYFMLLFKDQVMMEVPESLKQTIAEIEPELALKRPDAKWKSSTVIGLIVIGFMISSYIPLGIDIIALLVGYTALLLFKIKPKEGFKIIGWDMIFFFGGLFIVMGGLQLSGALNSLELFLGALIINSPILAILLIIVIGGILAAVMNYIPVAVIFSNILYNLSLEIDVGTRFWLAAIFAVNIGGVMPPIGSVAFLMAFEILRENKYEITIGKILLYTGPLFFILSFVGFLYFLIFPF